MTEHEGIYAAFSTYGTILKPISNILVGDAKLFFVVPLEPTGMFIYIHVMSSILEPLEVVAEII